MKISDGRVRSPFFRGSKDKQVSMVRDGSIRKVRKKIYKDASTDTADLVHPLYGEPASRFHEQTRKVQDFLYRQISCPALEDLFRSFPHVENPIIIPLWEYACNYEEERKNKLAMTGDYNSVKDEEELLQALQSILV